MRRMRWLGWTAICIASVGLTERAHAQVPYGYGINNGRIGPGYQAAYGLRGRPYVPYPGQRQTVTDYQSLINAITSIPGWYGPPARPSRPVPPQPTMSRNQLFSDDGKILWPSATPNDTGVAPSRHAAEEAVRIAVQEQGKYGQATIRHVVDARNKLDAFAAHALPSLKAKNAADEAALERFIVELKKTLATLAVHY